MVQLNPQDFAGSCFGVKAGLPRVSPLINPPEVLLGTSETWNQSEPQGAFRSSSPVVWILPRNFVKMWMPPWASFSCQLNPECKKKKSSLVDSDFRREWKISLYRGGVWDSEDLNQLSKAAQQVCGRAWLRQGAGSPLGQTPHWNLNPENGVVLLHREGLSITFPGCKWQSHRLLLPRHSPLPILSQHDSSWTFWSH